MWRRGCQRKGSRDRKAPGPADQPEFAQVLAALDDDSLVGPTLADHRGDFQMHSTWSDGTQTVAEMAAGCLARGHQYAAMTDHGPGLASARGRSFADLVLQKEEIDRLNADFGGRFLMLAGVEANILADGSLDLGGRNSAPSTSWSPPPTPTSGSRAIRRGG